MPRAYYWKTPEDAGLLILLLSFLGLIQTVLSYIAAFSLQIISTIVLTLVPLGVVVAQAAASAILADTILSLSTPQRRPTPSPAGRIGHRYLIRFMTLLVAGGFVLLIWGGIYLLWFFVTPINQPALLVKYILANTSGAIVALFIITLIEWLFKR